MHPTAGKLFQLIKRAYPTKASTNLRQVLEQISEACTSCATYSNPPFRFRATIPPDKVISNRELSMDLMWLNKKAVLHIVDTSTLFQNAVFIRNQSSQNLWEEFVDCWVSVYTGFPEIVRLDRQSGFTSDNFRNYAKDVGVTLQFSGIESHNAIGPGERYHMSLRRVFNVLKQEHPSVNDKHLLRLALKGINDTMGPNGLVPSLLVFGVLPSFPSPTRNSPDQVERFEALKKAKAEMESIVAEQRIKKALKSKLPPATKYLIKPGDQVRVYQEIPKRWDGPFTVTKISDKIVSVTDGNVVKEFNITSMLPIPPSTTDQDLIHDVETITAPENHSTIIMNLNSTVCWEYT